MAKHWQGCPLGVDVYKVSGSLPAGFLQLLLPSCCCSCCSNPPSCNDCALQQSAPAAPLLLLLLPLNTPLPSPSCKSSHNYSCFSCFDIIPQFRPFLPISIHPFLSDPGVPGVRSMGPDVTNSVQDYCADLTDVTLADEDSNSIPTDDVNKAILGNVAI